MLIENNLVNMIFLIDLYKNGKGQLCDILVIMMSKKMHKIKDDSVYEYMLKKNAKGEEKGSS